MVIPLAPVSDAYFTALRAFLLSVLPSGIEVVQQQDNRVPQPTGPDFVTMNEVARRRLSANVTTYADCAFAGLVAGSTLTVTAMRLGTVLPGAALLGAGVLAGTTIKAQQSGTTGGAGVYALSQDQQSPISGVPLASGAALIKQPTEIRVQVDVFGPASADNAATVTTLARDGYAALWFTRQGLTGQGIAILDVEDARQMPFIDGESQYETRFTFDVLMQVDQVLSPSQDFADSVSVDIRTADTSPFGDGTAQASDAQVQVTGGAVSSFGGFGAVDYSDLDAGTPLMLPAGQWVRLERATAPSPANFNLPSGPWTNFTFWDGSLFHAQSLGDVYLVKFTFTVTPMERQSGLAFSVRPADNVAFEFGPEPIVLSVDAGVTQTGSETFFEQVRSRFAASGATLYVMSTTGATLTQFSPEVVPLSHP